MAGEMSAFDPKQTFDRLGSPRSSCAPSAEKMRRRMPGMICDPVEPSGGVDPSEGICGVGHDGHAEQEQPDAAENGNHCQHARLVPGNLRTG